MYLISPNARSDSGHFVATNTKKKAVTRIHGDDYHPESCVGRVVMKLQIRRKQKQAWIVVWHQSAGTNQKDRQSSTGPHYRRLMIMWSIWNKRRIGQERQMSCCRHLWHRFVLSRNNPIWVYLIWMIDLDSWTRGDKNRSLTCFPVFPKQSTWVLGALVTITSPNGRTYWDAMMFHVITSFKIAVAGLLTQVAADTCPVHCVCFRHSWHMSVAEGAFPKFAMVHYMDEKIDNHDPETWSRTRSDHNRPGVVASQMVTTC